jgi:hypothetical protein
MSRRGSAAGAVLVAVGFAGPWVGTPTGTIYGAEGVGRFGAAVAIFAFIALVADHQPPARWPDIVACAVGMIGTVSAVLVWTALRAIGAIGGAVLRAVASWAEIPATPDLALTPRWGLFTLLLGSLSLITTTVGSLRQAPRPGGGPPRRRLGSPARDELL